MLQAFGIHRSRERLDRPINPRCRHTGVFCRTVRSMGHTAPHDLGRVFICPGPALVNSRRSRSCGGVAGSVPVRLLDRGPWAYLTFGPAGFAFSVRPHPGLDRPDILRSSANHTIRWRLLHPSGHCIPLTGSAAAGTLPRSLARRRTGGRPQASPAAPSKRCRCSFPSLRL